MLLIRVFNYLFTLRYISLFLFVDFLFSSSAPPASLSLTIHYRLTSFFLSRFVAYRLVFTVFCTEWFLICSGVCSRLFEIEIVDFVLEQMRLSNYSLLFVCVYLRVCLCLWLHGTLSHWGSLVAENIKTDHKQKTTFLHYNFHLFDTSRKCQTIQHCGRIISGRDLKNDPTATLYLFDVCWG